MLVFGAWGSGASTIGHAVAVKYRSYSLNDIYARATMRSGSALQIPE
jgi:hypothetical protein